MATVLLLSDAAVEWIICLCNIPPQNRVVLARRACMSLECYNSIIALQHMPTYGGISTVDLAHNYARPSHHSISYSDVLHKSRRQLMRRTKSCRERNSIGQSPDEAAKTRRPGPGRPPPVARTKVIKPPPSLLVGFTPAYGLGAMM